MLAVAILTRDRWEAVERCIESIYHQATERDVPVHLLVNGSEDDTEEMARTKYPGLHIHVSPHNLGCPGGRNHLMDLVEAEWVVHLDDDGTVGPGFIQAVQDEIHVAPADRAVVTGWIVDVDVDPEPTLTSAVRHQFSGGIAALRRSTFLELGGYPSDGYRQGEEIDYAIRLHESDLAIWRSANLVLLHPLSHSQAKREELLRTGLRQSLITGLRYAPWWFVIPWLIWKLGTYGSVALRLRAPRPYLAGIGDARTLAVSTLKNRRPVRLSSLLISSGRFNTVSRKGELR